MTFSLILTVFSFYYLFLTYLRNVGQIHHSDQGVQYAANEYVQLLQQQGAHISMTEVGQAWQNGYAERLMRTIKEEEVDLSEYQNFTQAYQLIEAFLEDVYMKKRIHSSLGYLTPHEYEQKWRDDYVTKEGGRIINL